jgi:hydrogenase small subunit
MTSKRESLFEQLRRQGVSRRSFLKFCAVTASTLGLPAREAQVIAETLATAPRPSVIWLSFQECTGCTESFTRSFEPTLETLILDQFSLDYHHTLQAAAGSAAEDARRQAMAAAYGDYILVVDGAVPLRDDGHWSTIGGMTNLEMLRETAQGAALVIALGSCAAFGGLPSAQPNPSGALGVGDLMKQGLISERPLVNVSGCPPVPEVITGVIVYYRVFGTLPTLDPLYRPTVYSGSTVHDSCSRLTHFRAGRFAESFDDAGARQGYCLYRLGCRGPSTYNACTRLKWNQGTSFPMHSGHGCLGCAEPGFWDRANFYTPL